MLFIKGITKSVASVMLITFGFTALAANPAPDYPDTVVIGGTLIDGTGSPPIENTAILIRNGVIEQIGSAEEAFDPTRVRTVDATGKYIVPGLTDAHTHIDSLGGIALTDEQQEIVRGYYPRAFLFHGVTTVLNMSSHETDQVLALRKQVQIDPTALLPRIYTGASTFTVAGGWGGRHGGGLQDPSDIEQRLSDYADKQVDLVKIINENGLGDEAVFPRIPEAYIAEIVRGSKTRGLPVFIHATDEVEYRQSIAFRPRAMAHGLITPQQPESDIITRLKKDQIFVVPTIVLFEAFYAFRDDASLLKDPLLRKSVPTFVLQAMDDSDIVDSAFANMDTILRMDSSAWARSAVPDLRSNTKLFAEAGIKIAVGTDGGGAVVHSFQGYNTPREMEILADCCLSNMETIVAASKTASEIMGATETFGTLQPGRSADLLILNADPLVDISAVRDFDRLMLRGRLIDRSDLTYQAFIDARCNHGRTSSRKPLQ